MAAKFPQVSKYQNGFANGVEILGLPVLNTYAGKVFWVSATDGSDSNKGTRDRPFATLSKAVSEATANAGDLIILAPNHKETITDALNVDKRGVTVMGLGSGGMRPEILLDSSTVTDGIDITAADVTVDNFVVKSGTSDMAAAFDVDATGVTISRVTFKDNTTHENFLTCITAGSTTDNVVDDLTVVGCEYYTATDSHTGFISAAGITYRPKIIGNTYMVANTADTAGQFIAGTAGDQWEWAEIAHNTVLVTVTATDTYPVFNGNIDTDNSGFIHDNRFASAINPTNASTNFLIGGKGFRYAENYHCAAEARGVYHPTATN